MKTNTVIFDKDGTLLDFDALWVPVAESAIRRIKKAANCETVSTELLLRGLGVENGITSANGTLCYGTYGEIAKQIGKVLAEHGHACEEDNLIQWTTEAFHESVTAGVIKPTCENLPEVLAALKEAGVKLVLVTADDAVMTEKCLRQLQIASYFDAVFTDDGIHPGKPDPYMIHTYCEREGIDRSCVSMVVDTLTDMEFARNGGIRGIGLAKTRENRDVLRQKADVVLNSLTELLTNLP